MIYLLLFFLGMSLASFACVVSYRRKLEMSIIAPSSQCESCKSKLFWWEKIPAISYLILRGKCSHCGERIPFKYFIIEVLSGIALIVIYIFSIDIYQFIQLTLIFPILLSMTLTDIASKEIYNSSLYAIGIVIGLFSVMDLNVNILMSSLITFLIFYALHRLSNNGIADGDVILLTILSFSFEPIWNLYFVCIAFIIGGIYGAYLLFVLKEHKKTAIPFVPFIAMAYYIVELFIKV